MTATLTLLALAWASIDVVGWLRLVQLPIKLTLLYIETLHLVKCLFLLNKYTGWLNKYFPKKGGNFALKPRR